MNLFPGWSLTNARNNQTMLDPHFLMLHPDGGISTDLHGEVVSQSKSRTLNMQVSGALHSDDEEVTEDRLRRGTLPGLQQIISPYSKKLKKHESQMERTLEKLSGDESRKYDKAQALKKFGKILDEMRRTTRAGNEHYRMLSASLLVDQFCAVEGADTLECSPGYRGRRNRRADQKSAAEESAGPRNDAAPLRGAITR